MPSLPAHIVPMTPSMAEAFHACLDAVARESLMLGQHAAPDMARVQAFVTGNAEAGHPQFAAWDGEQVLGWCDAIPMWADGLRHRGQLGMGVRADARRQGFGDALLRATLAAARRQGGMVRIDLEVRADNGAAIRLYQRHGFQLEGRRALGLCHRGVYFETVEMGLIL
jgi:ribosomal protein S18 acetylase RimI-like enzyme